jgi:hypothetical protein
MYQITDYSYQQAKKLGVDIKPSKNKNKKIDVFKNGNKLASIGNKNYLDYPNYLKQDKSLAEQRRKLYKIRHEKDRKIKGSAGYFADKILW